MNKAIGYIRISTKDQSNFSLSAQEKYIRDFCERQGYDLLNVYKDDGISAKNFDRPDWKDLERFVKTNHHGVSIVVVAKYDRFSRNVSEALQMIEMLENRYKIRIISVMEPIGLHPHSPYFFQFRTQMLLGAQVEWLVIRDRTRGGIRQANISGRVVNRAPIGYLNQRDEHNKPIIVIDPEKAKYIHQVYQMFLNGLSQKQISKELRCEDFKVIANSGITRILSNPIYAGLIRAKSYYDDPEKIVKGIHEAIIPEATWWKVQSLLKGGNKKNTSFNDDFPLKGLLQHECGKLLTAAFAQGKTLKVGYYRCMADNTNLNARHLHEQFDELLKELSLPTFYVEYLRQAVLKNLQDGLTQNRTKYESKKEQLLKLDRKMENLEEDRITRTIDAEAFLKWQRRYQSEAAIIRGELESLSEPFDEVLQRYQETIPLLANMHHTYHAHAKSTAQKQSMIKGVFEHGIAHDKISFRTPSILSIFHPKEQVLKEKGLLIIEQPIQKIDKSKECSQNGLIFEPLQAFLMILSEIKRAS